jgi:stage IV sporulation protein FB
MDGHRNPFPYAISLGTWFGTRVRFHLACLVLAVILCFKLKLELGLLVTVVLFLSILIHEFFHVFGARRTGGSADEILIWPGGGLAFPRPAANLYSELTTVAAGPFANLLLCIVTFPVVYFAGAQSGQGIPAGTFNPLLIPQLNLEQDFVEGVVLLTFALNWTLLLLNLLPIYPLDGGQIMLTLLSERLERETARFAAMRIGLVVGFLGAAGGLMFHNPESGRDLIWLVFIGMLLMSMNMYFFLMAQMSDQFDESFLGYDFSQGYTSLERSAPREAERRPGPIQRWKLRRAEQRRLREEQEQAATAQRIDELLDKVHREGMDALTDAEKRFLKKASSRYRSQGNSPT